jgi:curved DNA-binding protein CbpA
MLVYYLTLDLPLDATDQQIREAYLQKVKKYTPEKDPEKFRKINDAYEVVRIINEPTTVPYTKNSGL